MSASAWRWLAPTLLGALMQLFSAAPAVSHEIRPAYLQVDEVAPGRYQILWRTPVLSGMRLPVLLRLPSACRNVTPPALQELSDSLVERHVCETASAGLAGQRVEFVGLEATITQVLVRVQMLDGTRSTTLVRSSRPWVDIAASQDSLAVAATYLVNGIQHILLGADHLLFVFGLVLLVQNRWMLIKTVTAFTVAHSITLALATLGVAQLPVPPLNAAIALSILFLGPEIVRSWRGQSSLTIRHPWIVAFAFGLLHGFGFASALTSAGLPHQDLPLALVSFNVGVELGQLGFIAVILALEWSFRVLAVRWPRWVQALPGYTVGSLGAFWTLQRVALLFSGAS
jgi:hydrogenase/urease accessory protein HupE